MTEKSARQSVASLSTANDGGGWYFFSQNSKGSVEETGIWKLIKIIMIIHSRQASQLLTTLIISWWRFSCLRWVVVAESEIVGWQWDKRRRPT